MKPDFGTVMPEKRLTLDDGRLLQVATLIYRPNTAAAAFDDMAMYEVLLITSRGSGRWIIPKGWPMRGRTLAQAASREAYEEAGIRGAIHEAAIGFYHYEKKDMRWDENNRFHVVVFAILYQQQKKKWPEQGQRILEWLPPAQAASRVEEIGLKKLLRNFTPPSSFSSPQASL